MAGKRISFPSAVFTSYTSLAPVLMTSVRVPNGSPSSVTTFKPIRSTIKFSSGPSFTAWSLVTRMSFPLYFSMSSIVSYPLNFSITIFLKNLTPSISSFSCSFPVSRITCFSFLKRAASSVVGKTLTSPLTPCVEEITPTLSNCSIIFLPCK